VFFQFSFRASISLLVRHLELFFNKGAMLLSQNQPIAALYPPLVAGLPPFW